jgi:hypothetical protein
MKEYDPMTNPNPNPKSNEGRDRGTSQPQDEGTSFRGTSGFAPHQGKQQNPSSATRGGGNDAIECLDRCSEQLESARNELQRARQAISAQGSSAQGASQSQGQSQRNPNPARSSPTSHSSDTSEATERPSMGR